jgi:hypothetical protein
MIILKFISKIKFILKYFLITNLYTGLLKLIESKMMPITIKNQ